MVSPTWLVTGAHGMLGQDLLRRLAAAGDEAVGAGRDDLDITRRAAVRTAIARLRPAVVVNCAAWTDVDGAESHEAEAHAVNGAAPHHLAVACRESGALLLHISSDYVFSGDGERPYTETDRPAPRTAYGRTKLAGERAVLATLPDTGYVVRTAWLYGAGGGNFVRTVIALEAREETLDIVDDQRGQATWTADLADRLVRLGTSALAGTAPPGVYHGTSAGEGTWYDLAREVFRHLGADPDRVRPTTTLAFPRPAPRPAYSVLAHGRWRTAGVPPIRDWRSALTAAFPALRAAGDHHAPVRLRR
ncbi:dTDP-4-dehydrorhamnose reductase [Streptomyces sp. NPDC050145]|uniref:dTDP-4-dehydrorhamnose reductase n=1 Tax=Streptomyces sp. NPDC050145 TaxID=3365602 RepID=UPI0037A95A90